MNTLKCNKINCIAGFAVYQITRSLFKKTNLSHRFIPVALVFGYISLKENA